MGSILVLGRSSGEGNGNPLQDSCLENSMTEEPGGLQSMGSQRVRNNLATEQQQQKEMSYYAMKRHAGNKRHAAYNLGERSQSENTTACRVPTI